jgi:hypothetical protein
MLRSRLFTTATSLDLSGIITDETGTGSLVFSNNPTILTPTFNGTSTFTGLVNMTSGLTITPNATAPTTNVTIGPSAGANLVADSVGNICIGSGAGDVLGASGRNVAIGTDALGAFSAGAASITNTTPGTGGTPGTYTGVVLEKDSGDGVMSVYPTVTLTVNASGNVSAISITSPGSGATVASGIVFRSTTAGVPTNWRGTLATVSGNHIAIGNNALLLATPVVPTGSLFEPTSRIAIGAGALDAVTTAWSQIAIGENALGSTTVGVNNIGIGNNAGSSATDAANCIYIGHNAGAVSNTSNVMIIGHNSCRGVTGNAGGSTFIGIGILQSGSNTSAPTATVVGTSAFNLATNVTGCTAVGHHAGSYVGATGTTSLGAAENSIFIGLRPRANATSQTNQVVIGGVDAVGDGSNTTVLGNSSTVSTRMAGTATSVLRVSGDTVRVDNARTPSSESATGNAGDICWDANNVYVCTATDTWKRAPLGNSATTTLSLPGLTVAIPATTASSSTTTGALTVAGGVGIGGAVNVSGGMTVTPNASAPKSNVTIGPSAGASLQSNAIGNVMIGSGAGDVSTLISGDVAIGFSALGSATTAVGAFTTTPVAGGTGYTANQTGVTVTLVKKSGTSTFSGTVQASLTTDASGVVTAVAATPVSRGSLFTGTNIILEPTGFGAGSGCEISIASLVSCGENVAIGNSAAANLIPGPGNQGRGVTAVGSAAGSLATTQQNSVFVGLRAGRDATTGGGNTCVGSWAGAALSTGSGNTIIGGGACANSANLLTGSGNVVVGGNNIQSGYGPGSTLTSGYNNILIGAGSNVAAGNNFNSILISGNPATGNGSNTTTLGNSSTTGTYIPAGNLTLSNGNLILGTAGNGISFAATSDPTIAAVAATGTIIGTATNVSDGDTVTLGAQVYTFKTALTPSDYEVLIGADAAGSLTNLRNAILGTGGSPGDYQVPSANASASAGTIYSSTIPLTALTAGTAGNSIALVVTTAAAAWTVSAATLKGGVNAGAVSSEILSDYEEGTFTATYRAITTDFAQITYLTRNCRYIKIGRQVTALIVMNTQYVLGGSSGAVVVDGLPYTIASPSSNHFGAYVGFANGWTASPDCGYGVGGTNHFYLQKRGAVTGSTAIMTEADFNVPGGLGSNAIYMTITYFTN